MAFPLYSGVLSNGESKLLQNKSKLISCNRSGCSRADLNDNLIVRISSGKWNFRLLKLLKTHKFHGGLSSRHSTIGKDTTPSSSGISSIIAEVNSLLDVQHFRILALRNAYGILFFTLKELLLLFSI